MGVIMMVIWKLWYKILGEIDVVELLHHHDDILYLPYKYTISNRNIYKIYNNSSYIGILYNNHCTIHKKLLHFLLLRLLALWKLLFLCFFLPSFHFFHTTTAPIATCQPTLTTIYQNNIPYNFNKDEDNVHKT